MSSKTLTLILSAIAAPVLAGCIEINSPTEPWAPVIVPRGPVVTESRAVSGYDGIEVSGAGHVVIEQTGQESLSVTAPEDVLPLIRSEVVGGRLLLGPEAGVDLSSSVQVLYRVTVRELEVLAPSGASFIETSALAIPKLVVRASGASAISVDGQADRMEVDLSGASRFAGGSLSCRIVEARLSGASLATVRVFEMLRGSLSGASTLEYYGEPTVDVAVSGGSRLRRLG